MKRSIYHLGCGLLGPRNNVGLDKSGSPTRRSTFEVILGSCPDLPAVDILSILNVIHKEEQRYGLLLLLLQQFIYYARRQQ